MKRHLITTVSTIALLFGAATMATAQDKSAPAAQDTTVTTPSAGEIPKEGTTPDNSAMQPDQTKSEDHSGSARSMDSSSYKSYSENKDTMAGTLISGNLSAEQLLGAKVSNASGDTIGEIGDLMVDSNNQVTKAIVEVGGFLGIGSKNVVVDLSELKQDTDKGFVSAMTKDELTSLPEYKKENGNWVPNETQSDTKQ